MAWEWLFSCFLKSLAAPFFFLYVVLIFFLEEDALAKKALLGRLPGIDGRLSATFAYLMLGGAHAGGGFGGRECLTMVDSPLRNCFNFQHHEEIGGSCDRRTIRVDLRHRRERLDQFDGIDKIECGSMLGEVVRRKEFRSH